MWVMWRKKDSDEETDLWTFHIYFYLFIKPFHFENGSGHCCGRRATRVAGGQSMLLGLWRI